MNRYALVLLCALFPAVTMAGEGDKLAALEATLERYYTQLLAEARSEDSAARGDHLPEKYASQEQILIDNQTAFVKLMENQCQPLVAEAQMECKTALIRNRLMILGYEP